ncbi:superoxide dismutase family protein [Spongiivirga sp. MCCC 1A20706]|uniref:superoxide dismutase family protein n=1 Tax=Spongiivirga sp. MCCC 1A20706 TaxID=3160963 RepID=UPI0039776FC4
MKNKIVVLLVLATVIFSCKNAKKETEKAVEAVEETAEEINDEVKVEQIKFALEAKSESNATGEVEFAEEDGTVMMRATLSGLTPGEHAIHIHEKADCSSADGKSTGGHWNPTHTQHGKWGMAEGYHKGDIGNFTAKEDGTAVVTFETDEWCIGCDDNTKNIVGKAIIVHQGVDDFTSQPSGAAGARVSCGGIIQ